MENVECWHLNFRRDIVYGWCWWWWWDWLLLLFYWFLSHTYVSVCVYAMGKVWMCKHCCIWLVFAKYCSALHFIACQFNWFRGMWFVIAVMHRKLCSCSTNAYIANSLITLCELVKWGIEITDDEEEEELTLLLIPLWPCKSFNWNFQVRFIYYFYLKKRNKRYSQA